MLALIHWSFSVAQSPVARSESDSYAIPLSPLPGNLEKPVITGMSVSRDAKLLAAAGDDHAIRIISLDRREVADVLEGHVDWVRALSFSDDSRLLASCASDGWIKVWDLAAQKCVFETKVPHALHSIAFRGSDALFAVGFSTSIYRMDLRAGKLEVDHVCDCSDLRVIAVSPNQSYIAYAGRDGVLRVRTVADGNTTGWSITPIHFDRIRSLHFSSDSHFISSVGEDRRMVHFDVEEKRVVNQTDLRSGKLMAVLPLERDRFAVASADNTIRILGWDEKEPQTKLVGHDGSVCVLQRANNQLVSSGFDTTIRVWDLERVLKDRDFAGRYMHPISAQFEDSGSTPFAKPDGGIIQ